MGHSFFLLDKSCDGYYKFRFSFMKMYKNVAKNVPKEVELCEGAFFSRLNVYFLIRSQFQINHSVGRVLYVFYSMYCTKVYIFRP